MPRWGSKRLEYEGDMIGYLPSIPESKTAPMLRFLGKLATSGKSGRGYLALCLTLFSTFGSLTQAPASLLKEAK
jgi:hypothetical protein